MDVSNQIFTPRHYLMDPEAEDVVYGTDLADGMIVLLEDPLVKGDPEHLHSDHDKHRVMECNRWCEVTRFTIVPRDDTSPLIKFIGLYSDGTKFPRVYDAAYCWIIKKPVSTEDIHDRVVKHHAGNCRGCGTPIDQQVLDEWCSSDPPSCWKCGTVYELDKGV